jgi:glycosyltransferase involved in cell wall biosynthesis
LKSPDIRLLFITHNRLDYTKKALESILNDSSTKFKLTIWDNASNDDLKKFLKREVSDSRIDNIIFSEKNIGQIESINKVWSNSSAQLLGKLDNDCLVSDGWTGKLAAAHEDIEKLGVIACWHYFLEDFNIEDAKDKIQQIGRHKIFRHPFTCGTGFLIKNRVYKKMGPLKGRTTTDYWIKMALKKYINGFYYPLILQEHMDDPKSIHSKLKDSESFLKFGKESVSVGIFNIATYEERMQHRSKVIENLLKGPIDPKYYSGIRRLMKKILARLN